MGVAWVYQSVEGQVEVGVISCQQDLAKEEDLEGGVVDPVVTMTIVVAVGRGQQTLLTWPLLLPAGRHQLLKDGRGLLLIITPHRLQPGEHQLHRSVSLLLLLLIIIYHMI